MVGWGGVGVTQDGTSGGLGRTRIRGRTTRGQAGRGTGQHEQGMTERVAGEGGGTRQRQGNTAVVLF